MLQSKTLNRIIVIITILINCTNLILAQEVVEPLRYNTLLKKQYHNNIIAKRAITDTFEISNNKPFFDDFSQTSYYPKDSLWLDRNVFINSTSAHLPPSFGVATFDGLNEFGVPYMPGYVEGKGTTCDTLTSVPINLTLFQESDSLYLSFFYQAEGYGEVPDSYDSLVLEFKPDSMYMGTVWSRDEWKRVWSISGTGMHPFKQVILQVKHYLYNDTGLKIANFYHGGFQFRFINYGNLSGNLDLWHIDYVYLNKNRTSHDSIYEDLAVVKLPQSLLKDYTSVPASHLLSDHTLLRNDQYMYINNLYNTPINVRGRFLIEDLSNQHILLYNANSSSNSYPQKMLKLNVYDSIGLQFPFDQLQGDTIKLRSEVYSYYLQDIHKENDLASRYHEFFNYYAYDDGTAENGYSIDVGDYKNGQVAYHFKMASNVNSTDSLRGISIFFNYSEDISTDLPFLLMVWKDFNSDPVRSIEAVSPIITDTLLNGFYTYRFEHPVGLDSLADANGNFYIGWKQNSAFRMNIGLDRNYFELAGDSLPNKSNTNIHYFTGGTWKTSIVSGALMMRPIISKYKLILPGAVEHPGSDVQLASRIYPNPAQDYLTIFTGTNSDVMMLLTDMQGRERKREIINNSTRILLDGINPGMYIIVLTDSRSQRKYYHKLIIHQ